MIILNSNLKKQSLINSERNLRENKIESDKSPKKTFDCIAKVIDIYTY